MKVIFFAKSMQLFVASNFVVAAIAIEEKKNIECKKKQFMISNTSGVLRPLLRKSHRTRDIQESDIIKLLIIVSKTFRPNLSINIQNGTLKLNFVWKNCLFTRD
jgi:hypothetical protein